MSQDTLSGYFIPLCFHALRAILVGLSRSGPESTVTESVKDALDHLSQPRLAPTVEEK